jgi:hypothetical protein
MMCNNRMIVGKFCGFILLYAACLLGKLALTSGNSQYVIIDFDYRIILEPCLKTACDVHLGLTVS